MKSSRSVKIKREKVHEKCIDKENVASEKAICSIGRQHLIAAGECRNVLAGENDGNFPLQAAKAQKLLPRRKPCSPVTEGVAAAGSQQLDSHKKIKLQLFPINKFIRQRLEKDGCNPYLELTLSAKKKISSVIKHLNVKWKSSSLELGELFLFPYDISAENLASEVRWSLKDINISAGAVYAAMQSPAVFRLRYGWFCDLQPKAIDVPDISLLSATHSQSRGIKRIFAAAMDTANDEVEGAKLKSEDLSNAVYINEAANVVKSQELPLNAPADQMVDGTRNHNVPAKTVSPWHDVFTNLSIGGLLSEASLQGQFSKSENKSDLQPIQLVSDVSVGGLLSEVSLQGKMSSKTKETAGYGCQTESKFSWDFNVTNLSIGGLLSEVSLQEKIKDHNQRSEGNPSSDTLLCFPDSLDAFISSRLNSKPESHSSILDAEETCHAFPVRKLTSGNENATSPGTAGPGNCHESTSFTPFRIPSCSSAAERAAQSVIAQEVSDKDNSLGLKGIKWENSLGPFDLGLPTLRPVSNGDGVKLVK